MVRKPFSTGDAIALSSPSGSMSKRARQAALNRLHDELFKAVDEHSVFQVTITATNQQIAAGKRSYARTLIELADRGMKPRVHRKLAQELIKQAEELERE